MIMRRTKIMKIISDLKRKLRKTQKNAKKRQGKCFSQVTLNPYLPKVKINDYYKKIRS
jgi:hypothetical protein